MALADFLALTFAMNVFFQLLYVKLLLPDERLYMFLGTLVFGEGRFYRTDVGLYLGDGALKFFLLEFGCIELGVEYAKEGRLLPHGWSACQTVRNRTKNW